MIKGANIKLPAAEREGFTFKGWYTDKQVFTGMAGDTYQPEGDISLYAGWEKAASSNDSAADAELGTSSEKSGNTATSVSGVTTEGEPVIQTGRTSPVYLLAVFGLSGIPLAALSIREGKNSSEE